MSPELLQIFLKKHLKMHTYFCMDIQVCVNTVLQARSAADCFPPFYPTSSSEDKVVCEL